MTAVAGNRILGYAVLIALGIFVVAVPAPTRAPPPPGGPLIWVHQFGTSADDAGYGLGPEVAADASGIYVVGMTAGTFQGQMNAGGYDAFLRKINSNGNAVWTREFGTSNADKAEDVALDASGVYVAGWSEGVLPGQASAGAYIRKYDTSGNEVWTRQFGPALSQAHGVAIGTSGVYVVGQQGGDAFIRKYDASGNFYWLTLFGISDFDFAYDVAVDASGEHVVGSMQNGAEHDDAFIWKFDASGNVLWSRLFGSQPGYPDAAYGVAFDSSGICVSGTTSGALPGQTSAGLQDAFLRKYDASGNELWTRQFGSSADDLGLAVAGRGTWGCYIAGETWGTLFQPNAGGLDAFIELYDPSGNLSWLVQFGSSADDSAWGIAVNSSFVYPAGWTFGKLGQKNYGNGDAYVARAA